MQYFLVVLMFTFLNEVWSRSRFTNNLLSSLDVLWNNGNCISCLLLWFLPFRLIVNFGDIVVSGKYCSISLKQKRGIWFYQYVVLANIHTSSMKEIMFKHFFIAWHEMQFIKHERPCLTTFETSRRELKLRRVAEYFWQTSTCLECGETL